MKKIIALLLIIASISSCQKNDLSAIFDCKTSTDFGKVKKLNDVMKKFKLTVPIDWKTQLYYDNFHSEIYSADTTKSLTETFIIEASWHQGELYLNKEFEKRLQDTLAIKEGVKLVRSDFINFKKNPAYWNLSKGKKGDHNYHFLQVYVKTKVDEYYTFTTKIYGDSLVNERFCNSIQFYNQIEFLKK